MAVEDTKGKKRKGAPDAAPKAKKPRKSDDTSTATKPSKSPKAAPAVPASTEPKAAKGKSARKQAADLFDNEEASAPEPAKPAKGKKAKAAPEANGDATDSIVPEAAAPKVQDKAKKQGKKAKVVEAEDKPATEAPKADAKKSKKAKQADAEPAADATTAVAKVEATSKKSKKAKGGKTQEEQDEEPTQVTPESNEVDGDVEEDDQTAALLAGFESDGDSEDPDEDLNFDEDVNVPALTKKQRKDLEKAEKLPKSNEPGVIYVGRVPRGFFEAQMKKYFSQFGKVNRLRLSRNKKTGASKHYAFVEFASTEVADIVARTMDNYLMFGHILKCKLIPAESVHPDLFKGAGQRFKVDPRNKKAGLEMERGVDRAQWEKRVTNENKRRVGRNKQLKEDFGYEYTAPGLKAVKDVSKQTPAVEDKEPQQLLTEAPVDETPVTELPKAKKGKKIAKGKVAEEANGATDTVPEKVEPAAAKKSNKKRKSDVTVEATNATEDMAATEPLPKTKKSKKESNLDSVAENVVEKSTAAKPKKAKKAKA